MESLNRFLKSIVAGIVALAFFVAPVIGNAQSTSDIQSQINAILAQIKALQEQLNNQAGQQNGGLIQGPSTGSAAPFCTNFTRNLRIGDTGEDVKSLNYFLAKSGLNIPSGDASARGVFTEALGSAVSEFQEKYFNEILRPNQLIRGNGYVGSSTRGKLNALYGCRSTSTQPPIKTTEQITPYIGSITPASAPVGTTLEIRGSEFHGFESDVYFYFERADGKKVRLPGVVSQQNTGDAIGAQTAKVILKEPCQQGQVLYADYSALPYVCDYVQLTPGVYKVYTQPWGKRSNVSQFTITETNSAQPIIYFFTPTHGNVKAGESNTLSWEVVNAQRCVLQYGSSEENVALKGTKTVYPTQPTSYKLWCANDNGTGKDGLSTEKTTSIGIINATTSSHAPTCKLTSNKTTYKLGEIIEYYWTSQNANYAYWEQDTSGKDSLKLPGDKLFANGAQHVTANVVGNPRATLMVRGDNGTGSCVVVVNVD